MAFDHIVNNILKDTYTHSKKQIQVPKNVAVYVQSRDCYKCGNCKHFIKPSKCTIVKGTIKASGCCNLWEGM